MQAARDGWGTRVNLQFKIRNGLNIPITGEPEQRIHPGPGVHHVALSGLDYPGLKPKLLVTAGDSVGLGQTLFVDKRDPVVQYGSPGQGTVIAVNRGARRVLETVVVRLADNDIEEKCFSPLSDEEIQGEDRGSIATRLHESGLWTAFRTRPYSQVPVSGSIPRSVFVTAIDTQPLAADPCVVIRAEAGAFASGLLAVSMLTQGRVHLCVGSGWDIELPEIERLQQVEFTGPHPAGLPGTHIHHLDPVGADRMVWHIGYQDVIAIGKLFATGRISTGRVIALGGACVREPRLISCRQGASTEEMTRDSIQDPQSCRVVSGSVLNGRSALGSHAYLGRYHTQLSVIREGGSKSLFGWLGLRPGQYTAAPTYLKKAGHKQKFAFSTSQNGRFSGMLPMRVFDKVMPLDILPSPLFRALMVKDTDQAQALGCLELDEEDLALCSFVCPAKYDYGSVLRINLKQIEREG
ncbi:Na(+)-translocating NADH-quinone reductase subunit A [Pseudomonadota bacterium]